MAMKEIPQSHENKSASKEVVYDKSRAKVNLSSVELLAGAVAYGEGVLTPHGALVVETGKNTGRSPNDKFFVNNEGAAHIDLRRNKLIDPTKVDALIEKINKHLNGKEVFVQQLFAGADPEHRINVEVVTETHWQGLFAQNLFIRPTQEERENFKADWKVIDVSSFLAVPERDGTRSEVFIILDNKRRLVLIGGTGYAGEIKKSIFTALNYSLPFEGILPMHCGASLGEAGDVSLFFGLSGTGKTTLSSDPQRIMIGDDEHGWTQNGIFNFEGGFYAKVVGLKPESEPVIAAAINRPGTVLENVVIDPLTHEPNYKDDSKTENTRAAYPREAVERMEESGMGTHPTDIFFLSADAFGVLPPIVKLTPQQAVYYFLNGYTAKVAGTEKGIKTPQATFSACFGEPFMAHPPEVYGRMLKEKIAEHGVNVWMVNTGWSGGPYGVGERMSIEHTRALIRAAQNRELDGVETRIDPVFGFEVPLSCPGVPDHILDPRLTWEDQQAYDQQAQNLRGMFEKNTEKFDFSRLE